MEARFSDIVRAYHIDQQTPLIFRALYKVKKSHLAPIMQYGMKVNIAAQLMSHTVGAFLYTLLCRGELEQRSTATATFVKLFDELFDSFNGSKAFPPDGKPFKCCVTKHSGHVQYWQNAVQKIRSINFVRRTKTGNLKTTKPPSQIGWLISLKAIEGVWNYLSLQGVSSLRPRSLNQDSLENLFGAIRGSCGSGNNPTPFQFSANLKTQILNGLARQTNSSTNCESDDHELLTNLTKILSDVHEQEQDSQSFTTSGLIKTSDVQFDKILKIVEEGEISCLPVAYVSGFIVKKLFQHITCTTCKQQLATDSQAPHNLFVSYKEWSDVTQHLQYPSELLVATVSHAISVLEHTLNTSSYQSNISSIVVQSIAEEVSFLWFSCADHQEIIIKTIIQGVCKIGIKWWCKRKTEERMEARKDARKYKHKLRKFMH